MLACASLAEMYEKGDGVIPNPTRARELYQRACEGGYEEACKRVR